MDSLNGRESRRARRRIVFWCLVIALAAFAWLKRDLWVVLAAWNGRPGLVRLLVRAGGDVHHRLPGGFTILHAAVYNNDLEMLRLGLSRGVPVDSRHSSGTTPLMLASNQGHLELVRVLLDAGADIEARSPNGDTPLGIAVQRGHEDVAGFLIGKGADCRRGFPPGYLYLAARFRHPEMFAPLVACGADVNRVQYPYTVLMLSARAGDAKGVRFLLDAGADPNATNSDGETALMLAAENCRPEVVRLLLEAGARGPARPSCDETRRLLQGR